MTIGHESPAADPDYESFCKHLEEWDRHNVAYGLRDMAELALRYHCPIPEEMRWRFRNVLEVPGPRDA